MPEETEISFGDFYKSDARTGVNICAAKKLQFSPDVAIWKPENYLAGCVWGGKWIESS